MIAKRVEKKEHVSMLVNVEGAFPKERTDELIMKGKGKKFAKWKFAGS